MATGEDSSSESPVPDIPPSYLTPQTARKCPRVCASSRTDPGPLLLLSLVILSLSCLPVTAAHPAAYSDGPPPPGRQRPAPVLRALASIARWGLHSLASANGYELVPHADHLAKREHTGSKRTAEACMIPVLVILSGVFAGLTLGYFSVDPTQLQVLSVSGTPQQQAYARRIMPVRKDSHLLLTTLILGNMIVNEALPVITDGVLGGGIYAVIISTALVVIFAEIIPQSVCSRHGLAIGAKMAPVVRVLIWIFFPLAWPIAKLLELILGAHNGIVYRRGELRELINIHAASNEAGGDLDRDTVTITRGALDLAQKTVHTAMTPIDKVFMLSVEARLDYETLDHVVRSGHSRIPVFKMIEVPDIEPSRPEPGTPRTRSVKKIVGSMLVKSCVLLDPEDATPLASIHINSLPTVPFDEPLTNVLNVFQDGRSHMAIVSRRSRAANNAGDVQTVATASPGGLRQRIMRSMRRGGNSATAESEPDAELGLAKRSRKKSGSTILSSSSTAVDAGQNSGTVVTASEASEEPAHVELGPRPRPSLCSAMNAARLSQIDQAVPADAAIPDENLDQFIDGLEGQPLGIITLEDVLEELIGEEIYDEYDRHDGTRGAPSTFVPRNTVTAAHHAALDSAGGGTTEAAAAPLPADGPGIEATSEPSKRPILSKIRPVFPRSSSQERHRQSNAPQSPISIRAPERPPTLPALEDSVPLEAALEEPNVTEGPAQPAAVTSLPTIPPSNLPASPTPQNHEPVRVERSRLHNADMEAAACSQSLPGTARPPTSRDIE